MSGKRRMRRARRQEDEEDEEEEQPVVGRATKRGRASKAGRGARSTAAAAKSRSSKRGKVRSQPRDMDSDDDEDAMPEYPARITRRGLVPAGTTDEIVMLQSLVVNVAKSDADAVQRAFGRTPFAFVADAAVATAEGFEQRVDSYLAEAAARSDLLSPGGKTLVNPKNEANAQRRRELRSLVRQYEEEEAQWEAARQRLTGDAAQQAVQAAAALDDGGVDEETAQEFGAAAAAAAELQELAETTTVAAGALAGGAKAIAAAAEDAKDLVTAVTTSIRGTAFRGVHRGAPTTGAALVRGLAGTRRSSRRT